MTVMTVLLSTSVSMNSPATPSHTRLPSSLSASASTTRSELELYLVSMFKSDPLQIVYGDIKNTGSVAVS